MTQRSHFWEYIQRIPKHEFKEHKDHYVHYSIIYNRQDTESAPVAISRRVDKTMGYLHNGILLVCKKEENFTAMGGGCLEGTGIEQKEKGLTDMDNSV